MADLTVVIVSWNVRELLTTCLHALFAELESSELKAQVWVVDNASGDGTPEMVATEHPRVRLVTSGENLGFAGGNNLALLKIMDNPPPYVWLLNPDTEVLPGAATALISAFQNHPRAGVVGAKLLYGDRTLQHSAFHFPGLTQLVFEFFQLPARFYDTPFNGRYPRSLYEGRRAFPIDHPLGASMMVRTETIAQVGMMDEEYHMYCEEIDWCWRMRRAGWGALCVPTAEVIHHAGQSTTQVPIPSFTNLWISRARLYARHHDPIKRRLAQLLVQAGLRRRMRGASPEMISACQRILRAWERVA